MADTLEERRARYERIVAMRGNGVTMEAIGIAFDPPLTKQRVKQILGHPPQKSGRPVAAHRRDTLRQRLQFWEARLASLEAQGLDTSYPEARIRVIAARIAALETS